MNAAVSIDELRDAHIGSNAAEPVGVMELHAVVPFEQSDHGPHGDARGIVEIFMERHCHEVIGRYGQRPLDRKVTSQR